MFRALGFMIKAVLIGAIIFFGGMFAVGAMYANAATQYAQTHDMRIPVSADALKEIDPVALTEYVRTLNPDFVDQFGDVNLERLVTYLTQLDPDMTLLDVEELVENR